LLPWKKSTFGQHRQAGSTGLFVGAGDVGRTEVGTDHALAGRGLLDLGNHASLSAGNLLLDGLLEAAHRIGMPRPRFLVGQADALPVARHFLDLAIEDFLENGRYGHLASCRCGFIRPSTWFLRRNPAAAKP